MENVKELESNNIETLEVKEDSEETNEVNVLDELMNKATDSGYLTTDDLLSSFPEAGPN